MKLNKDELKKMVEDAGGAGEIRRLLLIFYETMKNDLLVGFFFEGKDIARIADRQAHFLLNAAGLIDKYDGKGPASAHLSIPPILSGHFDRRIVLLRETLTKEGLSTTSVERWLSFENQFREMIVTRASSNP